MPDYRAPLLYYLEADDPNNPYIDPDSTYLENLHWRKLNHIEIFQTGSYTKKISFTYNNVSTQRLFLLGINVYDYTWPYNPNPEKYSYNFEYDQYQSLPGYLSKKIDHWGYYKGSDYSIILSNAFYNQRQTNTNYLTIGSLKKIIYPTGGYTEFTFEPHSYSKISHDDRSGYNTESGYAGGLRIKTIKDYSIGSDCVVRNYKYIENYSTNPTSTISSGVLGFKPVYYWNDWRVSSDNFGEYSQEIFSNNNIIPLANHFGPHIGYSEVTEVLGDGSFIVYKYSNFNNSLYEDKPPLFTFYSRSSPTTKYTNMSFMRGKLLEEAYYNSNNSLVKKRAFTYRSDGNMYNNYILAADARQGWICYPANQQTICTGGSYKIYYSDYDVIQEMITDYYVNGSLVTTKSYLKDDYLVTSGNNMNSNTRILRSVTTSDQITHITQTFSYPFDNLYEAYHPELVSDFRISPYKSVLTSTKGDITKGIGANKITFKTDGNLIVPCQEFESKTDENTYRLVNSFEDYDVHGNLLYSLSSDGLKTTYLWGYNNLYLVAKIIGADYQTVSGIVSQNILNAYYVSSDYELYKRNELNKLRTSSLLEGALVTSYTYLPALGISTITDPSGYTMYYDYDSFCRLKDIRDNKLKILKHFEYHYKNQ